MTAHELARCLLGGPDHIVVTRDSGDALVEVRGASVCLPALRCNNPNAPKLIFEADPGTREFDVVELI